MASRSSMPGGWGIVVAAGLLVCGACALGGSLLAVSLFVVRTAREDGVVRGAAPSAPAATPLPPQTPVPPFSSQIPTETATPHPAPTASPVVSGVRGRIVFVCFDGRDDEICLMNSDGSRLTQLTDNEVGDFYPSLSPDGRYIFFARQIRGSNYEIFRMNTDGADVVQLTSNGAQNYAPDLSPDGARLVFTSTQGGRGQQVWVMNGDGSQATQLTTEGENIDPAWSPNGGFITFASNRSGSRQIWIMNADGSDPRQITDGSDLGGRHSLAPDGSTLAFYAGRREDLSRNVYLIRVDGTDLRQLTSGGDNLAPSFSPDGEWIAFTSARDGDNDIYLMRADGADVVNLTNDGRSNYQPRWGP